MPAVSAGGVSAPRPHRKYRRSDKLGEEITELCGYINAANFRLLSLIRVFDQEGLWQLGGLISCAHWLNWKCGIGMNAAREKVRVANALADLPKISASFSRGEISYSKVRAMTRIATPENEDYLLMIARHGTAHHVEGLVQRYRRVERLQKLDANAAHKRRADALADIAESYLARGPQTSSSADRYQVVLRVSAETAQRLCCDTGLCVLSEDGNGHPLTIGRKSRTIPPPMRRALRARDRGCRFPGCTHRHYVDGHHIEHWSDGGETGLDNLVLLCRRHHRLVHEGGFSCEKTADKTIEFRDPRGERIGKTGYIPPVPMDTGIVEHLRHRYEDLHIDALTAVTRYDGEGIDWDMAVEGLLH